MMKTTLFLFYCVFLLPLLICYQNAQGQELAKCANQTSCCIPAELTNGKIIAAPGIPKWGTVATFLCDQGYKIANDVQGSRTRVLSCAKSLTWDQEVPTCEPYSCTPPQIKNGYIAGNVKAVTVGQYASVGCNGGHVHDGPSLVRCASLEKWEGNFPRCRKIYWNWCDKPPSPENGAVTVPARTPPGGLAIFKCKPGHTLYGASEMKCERGNWVWGSIPPYCSDRGPLEETMRPSYVIERKIIDDDNEPTPTTAGNSFASATTTTTAVPTTSADQTWRNPRRSGTQCAKPLLQSGHVLYSSLEIGTRAVFVCPEGYIRNGPKILRCNENRAWVGGDTPKCVKD